MRKRGGAFIGVALALVMLAGCKREGHLFCTGHPPVCVHQS